MNQSYFDHEKLDVYRIAVEFVVTANNIIEKLPKGNANLADQLHRASTSITLNIAEGAGELSRNEKIRFYRIARRSATECAGIFDTCIDSISLKKKIIQKLENYYYGSSRC